MRGETPQPVNPQAGPQAGTVTFLFTDIEGSTRLLQELGEQYADLLREQRRLLRAAFQERGGREIDTAGDAFFVAFDRARDAVAAAVAAQRSLLQHPWPGGSAVRVLSGGNSVGRPGTMIWKRCSGCRKSLSWCGPRSRRLIPSGKLCCTSSRVVWDNRTCPPWPAAQMREARCTSRPM